jgi:hypothetical protein
MPSVEHAVRCTAEPDALLRMLAAVERWPGWCPLFRKVAPAAPDGEPADAWSIVALLGSRPFRGYARLAVSDDGDQVTLATITSASPVDFARYTFTLDPADPTLTLRIDYGFARGPGGWLVERFLVRRRLPGQIDAALAALVQAAGGNLSASTGPDTSPEPTASPGDSSS